MVFGEVVIGAEEIKAEFIGHGWNYCYSIDAFLMVYCNIANCEL